MKKIIIITFLSLFSLGAFAQKYEFTHDDTLRGSITAERAWWDLTFYHLAIKVNPSDSTISGQVEIKYKVLEPYQTLQIDLQRPLRITSIIQDGQDLDFKRVGNVFFVTLKKQQEIGNSEVITVRYEGKPRSAKRAPWDGGFSWKKDKNGQSFIATSCQGLGSSIFWPCKDHMYDEPDSMAIDITVPKPLMDVSNGRLRRVIDNQDNTRTFCWFVNNPINNYGVNINIANYVSWTENYDGEKGKLDLSYYVLPENLEKAKIQFQQTKLMLKAFEHWFGPYPFYEDGYKLVEVPYLGMEHQSSVTYGNEFQNGYRGRILLFVMLLCSVYVELTWASLPKLLLFSIVFLGTIANGVLCDGKAWGLVAWLVATVVLPLVFGACYPFLFMQFDLAFALLMLHGACVAGWFYTKRTTAGE